MTRSDPELTDSDQVAELAAELARLSVQDFGASSEKIAKLTPLLRELGRKVQENEPGQHKNAASAAREHLKRVLLEFDDPQQRFAIDGGLGLTVEAKSRPERYKALRKVWPQDISNETVDRRRRAALPVFAARLIELASEASDPQTPSVVAKAAPLTYFVDRSTMWIRFKAGGRVERFVMEQTVKAVAAGELTYLAHNEYLADDSPKVFEVRPLFGCDLVGDQTDESGVHYARLQVRGEVAEGKSYTFMYELKVTTDTPMAPRAMITAHSEGSEACFRLDFADCEQPEVVWSFTDLHPLDARREEARRQREHPMVDTRYVQITHSQLTRATCNGVSWSWPW